MTINREGKEWWFFFHNKQVVSIHLMLLGKLSWTEDDNKAPHTIIEFVFGNGNRLSLCDPLHMAKVTLNPAPTNIPDAVSKEANLQFWKEHLRSRATIKNLLLDQKVIRVIGNAYADEILWDAKISSILNKQ